MAVNEAKVATCESTIDYAFHNKLLCLEALLAARQPLVWQGEWVTLDRNDRLAVVGDSAIRTFFSKQWYGTGRSKSGHSFPRP